MREQVFGMKPKVILISSTGSFYVLLDNVNLFSTVPGGVDVLFPDSPRWLRITTKAGEEFVPVQQLMSATGTIGFRPACPKDMSDLVTFCIDKIPARSQVSWYLAAERCEAQEKRLCTNTEWLDACDTSPSSGVEQLPPPNDETESPPWPIDRPYAIKWYRCCK